MIELPFIGAFLEAAGTILEKKVLRNKKMNFKNYTTYEFMAIVIFMLPILYFTWRVDKAALTITNILIFSFVIIVALIANLLIFYSLKREKVTEFEPIWVMLPLFTIVLAFIFYSSERHWSSIILALIASLALIVAHVKKHHLAFDKYILAAILGSFLFAVELVASKPILQFYNPFTFYFIRCFFIFVICFALFRPNGKDLNKNAVWMIILIGLMWAFYRAIIYYGYETIGIVFTTTIFILSPVLMFIFAVIFLKEKPTLRQIVSTIVIVACVIASVFLQN